MWTQGCTKDQLQEGDIIELSTEYPLLLHYAVIVIENDEVKCAHYPYPERPCIQNLDYVLNNRPDSRIRRVLRTGVTSDQIIRNHNQIKDKIENNFKTWLTKQNCESYVRKVTGQNIGIDQRVTAILVIIIIILIIIAIVK